MYMISPSSSSLRPLNPRHFPLVGKPAQVSDFPILGDFEEWELEGHQDLKAKQSTVV